MSSPGEQRPMLTVLRTSPRPIWVLLAGVLINRIGAYFAIFATLFLTSAGFEVSSLPAILAGLAAAAMLGSLAGGLLADRLPRRTALVASAAASAVSLTFLALAQAPAAVIAAVCLAGFCTQSYVPAASALLVDHTRPEDRVPVFALFRLALNVGAALGPLIAGILASWSYQALFFVDAGTSAAFAILLLVALPRHAAAPAAVEDAAPEPDAPAAAPQGARSRAAVPLLLLALFGIAVVYAQAASTLPLHLADLGHAPSLFGALLALNAVLVIAAELPLSSFTRRQAWPVPLALGAILIAAGMTAGLALGAGSVLIAAVLIWTTGEMLLAPVAGSAMAELAPAHAVARYQSYLSTAQTLGFTLGPVAGTLVYAHSSSALPIACAAVGMACAMLILGVRRLLVQRQVPCVVAG